jgi:hypothetical protein
MKDNKEKKTTKEKDNLFTPGNIILGIIIIVLIGSLFFDFFGSSEQEEDGLLVCPRQIKNVQISNVVYAADGKAMMEDRIIKPEDNNETEYTVSALIRNYGDEEIIISKLGLTTENFGDLNLIEVNDTVIPANSMKTIKYVVPSGEYHKIDIYTNDPCEGNVLWHERGEGSKYESELEDENNQETQENSTQENVESEEVVM